MNDIEKARMIMLAHNRMAVSYDFPECAYSVSTLISVMRAAKSNLTAREAHEIIHLGVEKGIIRYTKHIGFQATSKIKFSSIGTGNVWENWEIAKDPKPVDNTAKTGTDTTPPEDSYSI